MEPPRRVDTGQVCGFRLVNLQKLIQLSPARLDFKLVEFTDRFDTVVDHDPISNPTFIVDTLCRVFIGGCVCICDTQGLRDGGTVDFYGLQKEFNEKCEQKVDWRTGRHCCRLYPRGWEYPTLIPRMDSCHVRNFGC